jgi:hypothetical protein
MTFLLPLWNSFFWSIFIFMAIFKNCDYSPLHSLALLIWLWKTQKGSFSISQMNMVNSSSMASSLNASFPFTYLFKTQLRSQGSNNACAQDEIWRASMSSPSPPQVWDHSNRECKMILVLSCWISRVGSVFIPRVSQIKGATLNGRAHRPAWLWLWNLCTEKTFLHLEKQVFQVHMKW